MVCAEQRSEDGQESVPSGTKDITAPEGKAKTFLQPSGRFRRIPTTDPELVGLVVDICVSRGTIILKDKPREINSGVG